MMSAHDKASSLNRKVAKYGFNEDWENQLREWYRVSINCLTNKQVDEMTRYCDEHFDDDWVWSKDVLWEPNYSFYFLKEEDITLFKLRYESACK